MIRSPNDRLSAFCGGFGAAGLVLLAAKLTSPYAEAMADMAFLLCGLLGVTFWLGDWWLDRRDTHG